MSMVNFFENLLEERKSVLDLNSTNKDNNSPVLSKDAFAASRYRSEKELEVNETFFMNCGKVFILTNKTVKTAQLLNYSPFTNYINF